MKLLHFLMRYYSYAFTLFLSVPLIGFGVVAFVSNLHSWKVDTFPWKDKDLSTAMLVLGLLGVASVGLAVLNWFRWLIPVMAALFFGLIVWGFLLQGYRFKDADEFQWCVALAAGAGGSFLCSLMEFRRGAKAGR